MTEEPRYSIAAKKGYKMFWSVCIVVELILAAVTVILSAGKCETVANYIFVIGVVIFFVGTAFSGVFSISKKVLVYKGKLVYRTIFKKKEYKISDVCTSKTENTHIDYGSYDNSVGYADDKVVTFYAKTGEKLFRFGLAYENVDRLQKDVKNTQRSIAGTKRR